MVDVEEDADDDAATAVAAADVVVVAAGSEALPVVLSAVGSPRGLVVVIFIFVMLRGEGNGMM